MKQLIALILLAFATAAVAAPPGVLVMPDGSRWLVTPETQPATNPTTPPAPPLPPGANPPLPPGPPATAPAVPPADSNVILVPVGQSWVQAVKRARSGQTVRLAAGLWTEGLTDTAIRPHGVKIEGAGFGPDGKWLTTIRVPKGSALVAWCWDGTWIKDIHFTADKPTQTGVALWGCHSVTLDRCEVSGFTFGVTAQLASAGGSSRRGANNTVRACLIHDNYNPAKRADGLSQDGSGMFASAQDALLITACTFEGNGWHGTEAKGSERCHNLYCAGDNGPAVVTENVFAHASSHGAQVRCGGTVANNLFYENAIGLSYGLVNGGGPLVPAGVTGIVKDNVFCGSRPLAGRMLGYAIEVSNAKDVTIEGNTFASDVTATAPGVAVAAIKLDVCQLSDDSPWKGKQVAILKAVIANNSVTWPGGPLWINGRVDRSKVSAQQEWAVSDVATVKAAAVSRWAAAVRGMVRQ